MTASVVTAAVCGKDVEEGSSREKQHLSEEDGRLAGADDG